MTPELLAPAGNPECLDTALYFGADAVYVGLNRFGMRAFAENFSPAQLEAAVDLAHKKGAKLYVALNALVHEEEKAALYASMGLLKEIGPDAIIFSDPAVLLYARELRLPIPLHLSTQASAANSSTCRFWAQNGVERIILAREVTLAEIRAIRRALGPAPELEVFVHGAMCVAYSGRCLLSAVMTGRSGNKGECAQPCRWQYAISEIGGDGRFFPITEEQDGTYILNAADLQMLEHLGELRDAGVDSFKIEGRNKSVFYVASVLHAYRRAVDALGAPGCAPDMEALRTELEAAASRQSGTGFFYGRGENLQDPHRNEVHRRYTFVAKVLSSQDGIAEVEQRNHFARGEKLEVLSPHLDGASFVVRELSTTTGEAVERAPHPQQRLRLPCSLPLRNGDLLRRLDS